MQRQLRRAASLGRLGTGHLEATYEDRRSFLSCEDYKKHIALRSLPFIKKAKTKVTKCTEPLFCYRTGQNVAKLPPHHSWGHWCRRSLHLAGGTGEKSQLWASQRAQRAGPAPCPSSRPGWRPWGGGARICEGDKVKDGGSHDTSAMKEAKVTSPFSILLLIQPSKHS